MRDRVCGVCEFVRNMMQVVMTNIRPSDLYAVHSVKHNQCRPVSTLRLHLQLGKRGPHSGPAAGALRAISAGRGATRQLLCSVCTAGAHRRAAPQRGSASRSSSTLLGQVRRGRVRHSAPSQRPVWLSVRSVRCDTPRQTRPVLQRLSR